MKHHVAVAPWQWAAGGWKALQGEEADRTGYRSDVWAAVSSVMHKRWPTGVRKGLRNLYRSGVMESEMLCSLEGSSVA